MNKSLLVACAILALVAIGGPSPSFARCNDSPGNGHGHAYGHDKWCDDDETPLAYLEIDAFVANPMKPASGEPANVYISISNIGNVTATGSVELGTSCGNGDVASVVYPGQNFGPGETRSDLALQWVTTGPTDCSVTAHVAYTFEGADGEKTADGSFSLWVVPAPAPEECVCINTCTPTICEDTCAQLPNFCRDKCGMYDGFSRHRAVRKCKREVGLPGDLCWWRVRRCLIECR